MNSNDIVISKVKKKIYVTALSYVKWYIIIYEKKCENLTINSLYKLNNGILKENK